MSESMFGALFMLATVLYTVAGAVTTYQLGKRNMIDSDLIGPAVPLWPLFLTWFGVKGAYRVVSTLAGLRHGPFGEPMVWVEHDRFLQAVNEVLQPKTKAFFDVDAEVAGAVNDFTRTKLREDRFFRKLLPPNPLANDELSRLVHGDKPAEGSAPAITLPEGMKLPVNTYILGPKYRVSFDMIDKIMEPKINRNGDMFKFTDEQIKGMQKVVDNLSAKFVSTDLGDAYKEPENALITRADIEKAMKADPKYGSTYVVDEPEKTDIKKAAKSGAGWTVKIDKALDDGDKTVYSFTDFAEPKFIGSTYVPQAEPEYIGRKDDAKPTAKPFVGDTTPSRHPVVAALDEFQRKQMQEQMAKLQFIQGGKLASPIGIDWSDEVKRVMEDQRFAAEQRTDLKKLLDRPVKFGGKGILPKPIDVKADKKDEELATALAFWPAYVPGDNG